MRLVTSLATSPTQSPPRPPEFYTSLSDGSLRAQMIREALCVADSLVNDRSRPQLATLTGAARTNRENELLATAIMLERLAALPYRWYTGRRSYNARRDRIAGYFGQIAEQFKLSEHVLHVRCRSILEAAASTAA